MVGTGKFSNRKPSWESIAMDRDEMLFRFCYHHPLKLLHWISPVTAFSPNPRVLSSSLTCPVSMICFMPWTSSYLRLSFLSWRLCYHISLITLPALLVPVSLSGSSCSNETGAHPGLFSYPSRVILHRALLPSMCPSAISKESKVNSKHVTQSCYWLWPPSVHSSRPAGCFPREAPWAHCRRQQGSLPRTHASLCRLRERHLDSYPSGWGSKSCFEMHHLFPPPSLVSVQVFRCFSWAIVLQCSASSHPRCYCTSSGFYHLDDCTRLGLERPLSQLCYNIIKATFQKYHYNHIVSLIKVLNDSVF